MKINMPNIYIQERNAITKLPLYIKEITENNVLIMMDEFSYTSFKDKVKESIETENINAEITVFKGECSMDNINVLCSLSKEKNSEVVIGIGGGKVLDVAKAVGYYSDIKAIMMPTAASTDGPASKISVLYENDGTFKEYLHLKSNPYAVIVDTEIIANAPVRLLKSGIGDALSTYFETRAGYEGDIERKGYSHISRTTISLSKECFDIIINEGLKAVKAVENKEVTRELENVIEAIIYLSCVGFENGSLAAAHSVANALSSTSKYNLFMHGEKVAFGTMVQLLLEGKDSETISMVREFCINIGLPCSNIDIGLDNEEEIEYMAAKICSKDAPIHNMATEYCDISKVKDAIIRSGII